MKLNGLVGCTTSGIGGSWDVGSGVCGGLMLEYGVFTRMKTKFNGKSSVAIPCKRQ